MNNAPILDTVILYILGTAIVFLLAIMWNMWLDLKQAKAEYMRLLEEKLRRGRDRNE